MERALSVVTGSRLLYLTQGCLVRADARNADPDHWQKGWFTVPNTVFGRPVTEADVQERAPAHRNKFGELLEKEGWKVLWIEGPTLDQGLYARAVLDPDRRRYIMWARVERKPAEYHIDMPDAAVPAAEACGLKLNE